MKKVLRGIFSTLLFLLYPYLVYRGIEEGVVWFAPAMIASFYLWQALQAKNTRVCFKNLDIVFLLILGTVFYQDLVAKLIPIFVQLSLMDFFGKTLRQGKGPSLVERFASLDFPEIPPIISQYCRNLTILWTGFFAFNVAACVVLALFAPVSWWALYTGVMIFALTGMLMVGEYIWRHFYFRTIKVQLPEKPIPGVKESIRKMMIDGRAIWLDVRAS
ncbi:MAG: hypothetical protein methR_P1617 [Methyloprofundus sp.]|nr:MAG: hypothetical protein methR_P1617 [Methyloprofundus sp.]